MRVNGVSLGVTVGVEVHGFKRSKCSSSSTALGKTLDNSAEATQEEIVLPRRKTWDKLAVLQTLAATVNRDPTAAHYMFQDDPYLMPRNAANARLFYLSKESGRNAAKYIIKQFPQYFDKTFSEPNIPCLMPETLTPQIEGVSEEALKERIYLRRVKESVDLFDQLVQAGTPVSLETTNSLLDLLCFYGDGEHTPGKEEEEKEDLEEPEGNSSEQKAPKREFQKGSQSPRWREDNNAERIFKIMPERNAHSYCTMIRGMVKHGVSAKAYDMYIDLLNNRHKADVHTFNALITAVPYLKERFVERWELAKVFLNHMAQQEVRPNLLTFNALLKTLRRCGGVGRRISLLVIKEMEALGIEPSLATYDHLLSIFYRGVDLHSSGIISEVLDNVEKRSFTPQDPDDAKFFATAMQACCDLKDIKLAYRLNKALEGGDNWKFLGVDQLNAYWSKFFSLLCMMEQIDVVLKWYKEMTPSLFYPTPKNILDLLQALDAANHLEVIPSVWEDMKQLGFNRRQDLLDELLSLMSREQHPEEIQLAFAKCAEDIKAAHEPAGREQAPLEWTGSALGNVAVLFSRAGRTQDAWKMMEHFQQVNRIPSDQVMEEFLNCTKQTNCPDEAIKLVKLAASLGLPSSQSLKSRMEKEFELSEKQRQTLESIRSDSDSSDSDSSDSDSDSDRD
ncbi:PREDICTED: pentatricopeptide repeat domain-containing protein 3, mitochondrial [Buceros rhinoceros silvestris]|uniref:pentatricopeptide repeat domain-containing protein 3, mitochondrial n=1 Tax=Buceros rhinoceros silvestris TaxID=175836 RepID=UPI00052868EC|nr:PREDICTED: pentatricopeptide repeat domain-containing protein 3, mitochondrial [Buceros rhinoceros silvestris]